MTGPIWLTAPGTTRLPPRPLSRLPQPQPQLPARPLHPQARPLPPVPSSPAATPLWNPEQVLVLSRFVFGKFVLTTSPFEDRDKNEKSLFKELMKKNFKVYFGKAIDQVLLF